MILRSKIRKDNDETNEEKYSYQKQKMKKNRYFE
jgi:hypothetical protein